MVRKKKRLSDWSTKEYLYERKVRIRPMLDVTFQSEAEKLAFDEKLKTSKQLAGPENSYLASLLGEALDVNTFSTFFVCEDSVLQGIMERVHRHGRTCPKQMTYKKHIEGHVALVSLLCLTCKH